MNTVFRIPKDLIEDVVYDMKTRIIGIEYRLFLRIFKNKNTCDDNLKHLRVQTEFIYDHFSEKHGEDLAKLYLQIKNTDSKNELKQIRPQLEKKLLEFKHEIKARFTPLDI
jgi:hypothetical protein